MHAKTTESSPYPGTEVPADRRDQKSQRIILGIGSERIAIDFFSRISKLAPETGDQPATVLPMKKDKPRQKRR